MFDNSYWKERAWQDLKDHYWQALFASLIASILIGLGDLPELFIDQYGDTTYIRSSWMLNLLANRHWNAEQYLIIGDVFALLCKVLIAGPMAVGLIRYYLTAREEVTTVKEAFSGFCEKYWRNVGAMMLVSIKTFLYTLLLIIPGIVKALEYWIIPYLLADDPTLTAAEAFEEARELMTGEKWNLFKLGLSFWPWFILSIVTMGAAWIFIRPYYEATMVEFYRGIVDE